MPCVTTPREDTTVHANLASQAMDGIAQVNQHFFKAFVFLRHNEKIDAF